MTDHEQIMVSALRYALGRRTYIVGLTCDYIHAHMLKLSRKCKLIMINDIEEQKLFGYGDLCDERNWMALLKELKTYLNVSNDSEVE